MPSSYKSLKAQSKDSVTFCEQWKTSQHVSLSLFPLQWDMNCNTVYLCNIFRQIPTYCIIHNLDTRQRNNLYLPQANLTIYQKGAYYSGIIIFNNLPLEIKNVAGNLKKFKIALKKFLFWCMTRCLQQRLLLQFLSAPEDGHRKHLKHVEYYCKLLINILPSCITLVLYIYNRLHNYKC
jgi:hypothetical protein